MFVKPGLGKDGKPLDIRDAERNDRLPQGKYRLVPNSDYWYRRVRDGDVIAQSAAPAITEMEGYEAPEGEQVPEQKAPRRKPAQKARRKAAAKPAAPPAEEHNPALDGSGGPVRNEPSGAPAAVGEGSPNATVKDPR
jgi:hypothetical protein